MPNEIIEFKNDADQQIQVTKDEIKRLVCPEATDNELDMFMAHCAAHRLDPIGSKDAYLVKYRDRQTGEYGPASIITSYHVFNRRARKFPDYAGIKSGVVCINNGKVSHKQGSAVYTSVDGALIGGWAEVYVKGWTAPAYVEVALNDFNTHRGNWKKMPGQMIEKVAKCQAWRLAYPEEFQGMYSSEEMDQAVKDAETPVTTVRDEPVHEEQEAEEEAAYEVPEEPKQDYLTPVRDLIKPFAKKLGYNMADAVRCVVDYAGVGTMDQLTEERVEDVCEYMTEIIETPVME